MTIISKSKLLYDYKWARLPMDDTRISGELDDSLLNRREGNEVLYFINKVCDVLNYSSVDAALKMERMIRNVVPNELNSQVSVKNWLEGNWSKH